jgi:aminoglycoside phosphotransferase (APT) family kinase protein
LHTYDHDDLQRYLQEHLGDFGPLESIKKVSDGQSNPTYLLSSGTTKYVLRAKPPGKLLKLAHVVDREFG